MTEKPQTANVVSDKTAIAMSDYCECGILKKDCTHPSCPRETINPYPKTCPACNQEPCTCVSECDSCGA